MTYRQTNGPRSVALVTCEDLPDLTSGDQLLAAAIRARGANVTAATWTDPTVAWDRFSTIVMRSTWDYFRRPAEFIAWLDNLEQRSAPIWNPVPTLRWNHDKRYLRELESSGIQVVPTVWVPRGSMAELDEVAGAEQWDDLVIKPAISGGAHQTWRTTDCRNGDDAARFRAQGASGDLLVQPYLANIERSGEWSLMFIEGQFTHAVRKLPRPGDFRVQSQHGGRAASEVPAPRLVEDAQRALAAAPGPTLYARVDGCEVDGRLLLMELELIEPELFLAESPSAVDRLADAVTRLATEQ